MTATDVKRRSMTVSECVGMTVNQYMFELDLTRVDLTHVLGVPGPSITRRMRGTINWSLEDTMRTAEWLGLEVEDLTPTPDGQGGWLPAPFVPGKAKGPVFSDQAFASVAGAGFEPTTSGL